MGYNYIEGALGLFGYGFVYHDELKRSSNQ